MKKFTLLLILFSPGLFSQTFQHENISLVSRINPNPTAGVPFNTLMHKYNGCWGWFQVNKNKEYAIAGASNGTYFIDITNPSTPTVSAFLPATSDCLWREMKTYQNYCYIINDNCKPGALQIVDMQYLPDSLHIVKNDNHVLELGHTLWIDNDRLYVGSATFSNSSFSSMSVFSLANPKLPVLLRRAEQDVPFSHAHDMYARNDTVYVSAGYDGLKVLKFDGVTNTFSQIGSYSGYPDAGYNHSSALTQDGKHLVFCDELPDGRPIHLVNVENLNNIQPESSMHPHPKTTPHNPFVIGNKWAIVSSYQDGLFIYDISKPGKVVQKGFYDTYYQGGFGYGPIIANPYGSTAYAGNWGAYPYLPSKLIIANDMQNGVFILDATEAYSTTAIVGVADNDGVNQNVTIFPNPTQGSLFVNYKCQDLSTFQVKNIMGQVVYSIEFKSDVNTQLDLNNLPDGSYFISVTGDIQFNKKLVISH